ncbi:MAG: deoxyribodipyrimidine photo-lyase [Haloferacaceae archaeon]
MQVHWHRRDLRTADNRALAAAAGVDSDDGRPEDGPSDGGDAEEPVAPVFVLDDAVLEHGSPPRVRFLLDALAALRERYRERGSDLLVRRGAPREELPALAGERDVDRVVWNRDYSGLARARDADVRAALDAVGVPATSFHDRLHHEPGSITTGDGEHYSVYSYFWKKWRDREKATPLPEPPAGALADVNGDPLPTLADLGVDEPEAEVPDAGPDPARDRLEAFCDGPIYRYEADREYPARDGTSRLSPHLKWGTVGVRAVYAATGDALADADEDAAESVEAFRSQLAWREFYAHVLRYNPDTVTANFREYERPIEWRDDPEGLQAWKDGETGYPIVDAGMRQLRAEAWMHNRVRMIVASFLTKDLLVDWRAGYDWFREKLVDHDTANDVGGWQWAASTGTDAQPYFRIFNPVTQGERYDPDAEYVAEYVPELRGVDPAVVHGWTELSPAERDRVAPDYPAPVVDHAERREAALATFRRARGEDGEGDAA